MKDELGGKEGCSNTKISEDPGTELGSLWSELHQPRSRLKYYLQNPLDHHGGLFKIFTAFSACHAPKAVFPSLDKLFIFLNFSCNTKINEIITFLLLPVTSNTTGSDMFVKVLVYMAYGSKWIPLFWLKIHFQMNDLNPGFYVVNRSTKKLTSNFNFNVVRYNYFQVIFVTITSWLLTLSSINGLPLSTSVLFRVV